MTNQEKNKCEEMIDKALMEVAEANFYYEVDNDLTKKGVISANVRLADRKIGYARGVLISLLTIDYKSEKLNELDSILVGMWGGKILCSNYMLRIREKNYFMKLFFLKQ